MDEEEEKVMQEKVKEEEEEEEKERGQAEIRKVQVNWRGMRKARTVLTLI